MRFRTSAIALAVVLVSLLLLERPGREAQAAALTVTTAVRSAGSLSRPTDGDECHGRIINLDGVVPLFPSVVVSLQVCPCLVASLCYLITFFVICYQNIISLTEDFYNGNASLRWMLGQPHH